MPQRCKMDVGKREEVSDCYIYTNISLSLSTLALLIHDRKTILTLMVIN